MTNYQWGFLYGNYKLRNDQLPMGFLYGNYELLTAKKVVSQFEILGLHLTQNP
jgi:hypothetical protein